MSEPWSAELQKRWEAQRRAWRWACKRHECSGFYEFGLCGKCGYTVTGRAPSLFGGWRPTQ